MIFSREDRKISLSLSAKIAVLISAALVFFLAAGHITYDALSADIMIKNGGSTEKEILTFKSTVGEALAEQGIVLGKHDKTNYALDKVLADDMTIEVYRSIAVEVTADGKTQTVHTTKRVIKDILADAGFKYSDDDMVMPKATKIAKTDTKIVLIKKTSETVTVTEDIPYAVTEKANAALSANTKRVVQKGAKGQVEKTYKISYADGAEVGREVVNEKVLIKAVDEIIEIGTKKNNADSYTVAYAGTVTTSRDGSLSYSRVLNCNATAYDAISCGKQPGQARTATGAIAQRGVIAVDPKIIPLGTRVYVEGYGYAVAADTGGAIKGNRIDVFMDSNKEALNWGRRSVNVYILN